MTREDLIDDFIRHASDLFPYDDPDREEKILRSAEHYADEVLDPNSELNRLCREHDDEFLTIDDILNDATS